MRSPSKKGLKGRFWEKVDKRSDDECWNWVGAIHSAGYGVIGIKNKITYAHRVSWELHFGPIPKNKKEYHGNCILHKCDNPSCVNPNHLEIGTQKDNIKDMFLKNRQTKESGHPGEEHYGAKLNNEIVLEIRYKYSLGEYTQKQLAKIYKVTPAQIHHIVTKKQWRHLK